MHVYTHKTEWGSQTTDWEPLFQDKCIWRTPERFTPLLLQINKSQILHRPGSGHRDRRLTCEGGAAAGTLWIYSSSHFWCVEILHWKCGFKCTHEHTGGSTWMCASFCCYDCRARLTNVKNATVLLVLAHVSLSVCNMLYWTHGKCLFCVWGGMALLLKQLTLNLTRQGLQFWQEHFPNCCKSTSIKCLMPAHMQRPNTAHLVFVPCKYVANSATQKHFKIDEIQQNHFQKTAC